MAITSAPLPQHLEAAANADLLPQLLQLGAKCGQGKILAAGNGLLNVHQVALQSSILLSFFHMPAELFQRAAQYAWPLQIADEYNN